MIKVNLKSKETIVVPITKQTLRTILEDFDSLHLSDEELEIILPAVQSQAAAIAKLDAVLDLSMVPPGAIFRAEPNR